VPKHPNDGSKVYLSFPDRPVAIVNTIVVVEVHVDDT